ncbi:MAG: DUF2301 domain-containing membrane protein [Leptolyngbyaceae bacterium]|nr:DUF2301 domain-containing membrane protein [Leptolyngbyaceae bacterium]
MNVLQQPESIIYQGQFGEFTITASDRQSVMIYRAGLMVAALSFAVGTGLVLWQGQNPLVLQALTPLYALFCLALGVSLVTIHIYMAVLHRVLQIFWAIGTVAGLLIILLSPLPFALTVYTQPAALFGIGFTFAALTGIFVKEAFCFNRLETKLLTPLLPLLILGHLIGVSSPMLEQRLAAIVAVLFLIFALRKAFQPIPPDIGDKTVFAALANQSNHG